MIDLGGERRTTVDCDLHMHSNYSFDSFMDPKNIIRAAKVRGLSVISVTDHGTMDVYSEEFASETLDRILEEHGILVVKGMEIKTDVGDVIGLFLEEEIDATAFGDVVAAIRDQDGIVVLPHPFHRNAHPRDLVDEVDLLEVRNGRCRSRQNEKATDLATETETPAIGGSDAHMYWEIGKVYTALSTADGDGRDGLRKSLPSDTEREIRGSPLPYPVTRGVSFASGKLKRLLRRSG